MGGLRAAGTIEINSDGTLIFPENIARSDVFVQNDSVIAVGGSGGGNIIVNAHNFIFQDSQFLAGIFNSDSPDAQGGDINIDATNDVVLNGANSSTAITNSIFNGAGNVGKVNIAANNISLTNDATIFNFVARQGEGNSGDINLHARENIIIDGGSVNSFISELRVGNSGNTNLTANNLFLTNGGIIQSNVVGIGDSGDINLNIRDSISIDGVGTVPNTNTIVPSNIQSNVVRGIGNSGNINITTTHLSLTNGGNIDASSFGEGNAGDITINAVDSVFLAGESGGSISSLVQPEAIGNAGKVSINTTNLTLTNGGQILSDTRGQGNAGNITINALDTISLAGEDKDGFNSAIASTVQPEAIGNAGTVRIDTTNLTLTNGARIISSTFGQGNAGNITINAVDTVSLAGEGRDRVGFISLISSSVEEDATGNAGTVSINTTNLTLNNGAQIGSGTFGQGNGGNLKINATDSIELDGSSQRERSGLFTNAIIGSGEGGDIEIFTDELKISNGATISAGNFSSLGLASPGTGEPGNIFIQANSLNLENEARIEAATQAETGDSSANITLQIADEIILRDNSFISAQAFNDANGGNLTINTSFIVAFPSNGNGNDLIASAERGDGGNINITAEALFGIKERPATSGNRTNDIDASSQLGLSGNVTFNVPDTNNLSETAELSSNVLSAEKVVKDACSNGAEASGLVLLGKGGIPPAPNLPLSAAMLFDNSRPIKPNFSQLSNQQPTTHNRIQVQPIKTSVGDIYSARGVIKTEDGRVILTAYPTNNTTTRTPRNAANCHQVP